MNGVAAIVPAAGLGKRFGSAIPKLFFKVEKKPVLYYTLKNLAKAYSFQEIIVASDPRYFRSIEKITRELDLWSVRLVRGGRTRAESVRNGLLHISARADWVLVHDAARPLVTRRIVLEAIKEARRSGGAISALPATSTVKRVDLSGMLLKTEDRNTLYLAQTPQVFKKKDLLARYKKLGRQAFKRTDEAALFDGTSLKVRVAAGAVSNFKITTMEDIDIFRFYLKRGKRG